MGQTEGETMFVEDFKHLRVYRRAFEAATRLFEITKGWPSEERYGLTDQIRRASRGVCGNIAEAWFKRRYPKHFVSKITDAGSEAVETLVWLDFAVACGYTEELETEALREEYRGISGGLVKMMNHPEQWCGPSSLVRETEATYDLDP